MAAGLDQYESEAVQERLFELLGDQAKEFASRVVLDARLSDLENGIAVYHVSASDDLGEGARRELRSDLDKIAGVRAGEILMSRLPVDYFGYFGRLDTEIRIMPTQNRNAMGKHPYDVTYVYTNPTTGEELLRRRCTLEEFRWQFGRAFK